LHIIEYQKLTQGKAGLRTSPHFLLPSGRGYYSNHVHRPLAL